MMLDLFRLLQFPSAGVWPERLISAYDLPDEFLQRVLEVP